MRISNKTLVCFGFVATLFFFIYGIFRPDILSLIAGVCIGWLTLEHLKWMKKNRDK